MEERREKGVRNGRKGWGMEEKGEGTGGRGRESMKKKGPNLHALFQIIKLMSHKQK